MQCMHHAMRLPFQQCAHNTQAVRVQGRHAQPPEPHWQQHALPVQKNSTELDDTQFASTTGVDEQEEMMTQHCVCNTRHPWHVLNHCCRAPTTTTVAACFCEDRCPAAAKPQTQETPQSHHNLDTINPCKHTVPRCNHPLSCLCFVRLALPCAQVVAVLPLWVERQAHGLQLLLQPPLPLPRELRRIPAALQHLLPNRRPKTRLHQHHTSSSREAPGHTSAAVTSAAMSAQSWRCHKSQGSNMAGWHLWQQRISRAQASSTACGSPHCAQPGTGVNPKP